MLGTGAADGWPNPFCICDSCLWAQRNGKIRTPTSVLVDKVLLIDSGPEAPRQALRAGVNLSAVRTVLISHVHTDHFDPAFLLHRSWVTDEPLTLIGPEPVIAECGLWLEPGQTSVSLRSVTAGCVIHEDGYKITVLPASHEALGEAVLYLIDDGRRRVLYACDTGPWAPLIEERLAGVHLDLVILEQTFGDREDLTREKHLGIESFVEWIDVLRRVEAVDERTTVVAAHLSHHNPINLEQRMERLGITVLEDGAGISI